jgi:hypothetical protein
MAPHLLPPPHVCSGQAYPSTFTPTALVHTCLTILMALSGPHQPGCCRALERLSSEEGKSQTLLPWEGATASAGLAPVGQQLSNLTWPSPTYRTAILCVSYDGIWSRSCTDRSKDCSQTEPV